jgi:N-acetylneuraminate synthase
MEKLNLNGRLIGPGEPPYIIAEIGSNHNGDMQLAKELIDAAKSCGADAAKFQSWTKTSLISAAEYERNTSYADKKRHFGSLKAMVEAYEFTPEQHWLIAEYCQKMGIDFLSSGFSPGEIDLLDEMQVPAFKIASMDINHLPLLEYIGSKGRPVFLSTGMSTLGEIERALKVLRTAGSGPVALLHCISIYPPEYEDIHLNNIPMLQHAFDLPVGFSDHTIGTSIPLAAIALGACVIEKHFTLDKDMEGWDHWISADPDELSEISQEGLHIFQALGNSVRTVSNAEMEKRIKFRRRIVMNRNMKKGEKLTITDLDFKRPGNGIHPDQYPLIIGKTLREDVDKDHELNWDDLV